MTPPEDAPEAMRTKYVAPSTNRHVSPTFIPEEGEGVFSRLGRNIVQGAVNSLGWHVFDYSLHVDMFKKKKKPEAK